MKSKPVRVHERKNKPQAIKKITRDDTQHKKQLVILEFFGTLEFDPNWNYKAERQKA